MTSEIVMSNETHLYIVMPYCRGGDLCMRVAEQERFNEDEARFYFRQIVKGLETLQNARICHRDLSPENCTLLDINCIVIDFGMCLRIPYFHERRHLMKQQRRCGKLPHMSPEIYNEHSFDGHAVDIWAAATVLLFMLTGRRFREPPRNDRAFDQLQDEQLGVRLSDEAKDLLKKMFRLDPRNRLTLGEIRNHGWMVHDR
mmetsp:Transcript_16768/g.34994  ORF Transcript_16768/g.34994 Transcript_16768/m.34994 type:complete len:200 (+) Transcript_16768:857-1456(+)